MRSYTIVGTGALGSLYGSRLAAAGHPVRFLGRTDVEVLKRDGLTVSVPEGEALRLDTVEAYRRPTDVPASDVIVIALKAVVPNPAIGPLAMLSGGSTAVVTLQNGLGIENDLADAADDRPLVGALCFTAANRTAPGHVELLGGGQITMAPHRAEHAGAVQLVAADFTGAQTPVTVEHDLVTARWKKVLWNAPFNTLSVLLGATSAELLADPDGTALVRSVMDEVRTAALATGSLVPETYVDELIEMTRGLPPYQTSMGLDARAGRPLETEVIVGRPVRAGQAAGVAMNATATLLRQLLLVGRRRPA